MTALKSSKAHGAWSKGQGAGGRKSNPPSSPFGKGGKIKGFKF